MKPINYNDHNDRCQSCECSGPAHTKEGKCLYGPGTYQPWRCSKRDCSVNGGLFLMANAIFRTEAGRYYHGVCLDDVGHRASSTQLYGRLPK